MPDVRHHTIKWRAACAPLFVLAVIAGTLEAQQDGRFAVLVVPPAKAGTCMPMQQRASTAAPVRPGHRLVMMSIEPGSSREISMTGGESGETTVYSDRSHIFRSLHSKGSSIFAVIDRTGHMTGFRLETETTIPDSVLRMKDIAAALQAVRAAGGTVDRRDLNNDETKRVRSMIEFIRRRCP